MDEVWMPIPGFSNYEASNRGRVRSLRGAKKRNGTHQPGRILTSYENGCGYWRVMISHEDRQLNRYVHRLIRTTFGENHHKTTLTNDQVLAIRCSPESSRKLAKKYGVSKTTILLIKKRKTWKYL